MMSPRWSGRYGRNLSYQAPVPPKINLLTTRWSPISSVPSIDADGILKACTMKVVPNRARITVTSSDSRYSERVVSSRRSRRFSCLAFHSCPLELFQRAASRPLLLLFFRAALAPRQAFPVNPNFDLESLLMIRPALSRQAIVCRRLPSPLQKFLQRRFAV